MSLEQISTASGVTPNSNYDKIRPTLESLDRVALSKGVDHPAQYAKLHAMLKETKSNDNISKGAILWRLSRSAFFMCLLSDIKRDNQKSKNYLTESHACAKKSIESLESYHKSNGNITTHSNTNHNPVTSVINMLTKSSESMNNRDANRNNNYLSNISDAHTWTAVGVGRQLGFHAKSHKEKVTLAFEYKYHIDAAMAKRPSDWMLKYMMGRYMFSMARLNWFQKKLAIVVFRRSLPDYTYDDAIQTLTESLALFDKSKAVYFYLGKCHARKLNFSIAIGFINRGISAEGITLESEYYDTALLMLRDKCLKEDDGSEEDLHVQ